MNKIIILICILCSGCAQTKFVEKNSEELSKAIYAADNSMDLGRVDLADKYIDAAVKLVPPPKQKIQILPIYE
jgi:hypothetical protein